MNLAQPGWLALLLLLPLVGVGAFFVARLRKRQWAAFVAPRLRDRLLKRGSALPRWFALFFLLASCFTLIIALSRPRGDAGTKTEKTQGRNVMIALDISRSMRVDDVKPDRLSQAKVVIYELLEAMPNERIGFIGFAGSAYVYAPLTIDHSAVRETVDQIDEEWAPLGGSDLAAAVKLATETLKKTGQENNALVVLSDGEKHDDNLDEMISAAEQSGVYIVAIGVGTEDGGFVPNKDSVDGQMKDRDGRPVISRLQPEIMRKLAEDTKGRFALAGAGLDSPALVKSVVSGLDAFEMDSRERRISIEFYQWLVFPAILFLTASIIAGTRWKGIHAALLLGGIFLTMQKAGGSEATRAMDALSGKRYEDARDAYHKLADKTTGTDTQARYRLGEAIAAYRAGDFRGARSAYSLSLLSPDNSVQAGGHLGMGNTLFQLGWKGLTGESYPTDPASIPDLDRFETIVKEALAKMRESEEDASDSSDTAGFGTFFALITNWTDAVRHYDSSLKRIPSDKTATANRETTMTYLKKLQELLIQEEQETREAMQQGQPGEGPPNEGEGDGEGEGEGQGDGERNGKGRGNRNPNNDGRGRGDKKEDEGDKGKDGNNPNESPEERASRLLKENADTEKGPLTPGRREFRGAEKDW